jgi:hypothetical protein
VALVLPVASGALTLLGGLALDAASLCLGLQLRGPRHCSRCR